MKAIIPVVTLSMSIFAFCGAASGAFYYLHTWTNWSPAICWIDAAIFIFIFRVPVFLLLLSILGAHYFWGWGWVVAALPFFFYVAFLAAREKLDSSMDEAYSFRRNMLRLEKMIEERRNNAADR